MTTPDAAAPSRSAPPANPRMDPGTALSLMRLLAWSIGLAVLITGIALTIRGSYVIEFDDGMGEVVAVWPAGLVLLGTGVLAIIAVVLFDCCRLAAVVLRSGDTNRGAQPVEPYRAAESAVEFQREESPTL